MPTKEQYQKLKTDPIAIAQKRACDRRYRSRHRDRLNQEAKLKRETSEPNRICGICGTGFFAYSSLMRFCSRSCNGEHMKRARLGKNNPAYRNGFYRKGFTFYKLRQRDVIATRAQIISEMEQEKGYIYCQRCNTSNSLKWELHHIVYRSEAVRHPNLHNRRNLILCCIKCHNAFHKRKDSRNDLVKERRLWELFPEKKYLQM